MSHHLGGCDAVGGVQVQHSGEQVTRPLSHRRQSGIVLWDTAEVTGRARQSDGRARVKLLLA